VLSADCPGRLDRLRRIRRLTHNRARQRNGHGSNQQRARNPGHDSAPPTGDPFPHPELVTRLEQGPREKEVKTRISETDELALVAPVPRRREDRHPWAVRPACAASPSLPPHPAPFREYPDR